MISKIKIFIWSTRRQFLFYALIGCSAFVLDIITLIFLKEFLHIRPVMAVVFNQILIVNYVFFLNKKYSFNSQGQTQRQMIKFYLLSVWNYSFAIFWMWLLNERLAVNYLVARVSGIILAVCWNFLLYKYWVYKKT